MLKQIYTLFFLITVFTGLQAQISVNTWVVDTTDTDVKTAIDFYKSYLNEFNGKHLPVYSNYWSDNDCKRYKVPDPIAYSVSSDYPTYNFGKQKTIFYVRKYPSYVHIKTLLTQEDSQKRIWIYASTNHYVSTHDSTNKMHFISPIDINKDKFKTVVNGNITYHFPVSHKFDRHKSNSLIKKLKEIEKEWNIQPVNFDYYFADNQDKIAEMRGMDYSLGMEQTTSLGMSFPDDRLIFCSGYGENYLHEALHLYFDPFYEKSPINHGLIYFLSGGSGHDFNWMIHRMNEYLVKYPSTDLSQFESIETKDIMLHIDYTVNGLICKMIYEKEGVNGLKRLLSYSTMDELFFKEFHLNKNSWDSFLKQQFKIHDNS